VGPFFLPIPTADPGPFSLPISSKGGSLSRTPPCSSLELGILFDEEVGRVLAEMLGGIHILKPGPNDLIPPEKNCVEVGPARVIGGVRPQNFDVAYRPDGLRFVFDSKTLNDAKSVQKNYQNMINDLGTEATNVHTRFPYAIVAFMVIVPEPCLGSPQKEALTGTLERLSNRGSPLNSVHKAEAISLVIWKPDNGEIIPHWPKKGSILRIEEFSTQIEKVYLDRYKGLPPHT